MALDPSDLLELPFNFGECEDDKPWVQFTCECFKEGGEVCGQVRKCGNWVTVHLGNITMETKEEDIDFATIKIEPFLSSEFLGENARKRLFGGLAKVFDLETNVPRVVPAVITMETDGSITINPYIKVQEQFGNDKVLISTSNYFFTSTKTKGTIGTFTIKFTYVIDDGHEYDDNIKFTKLNI